MTAESYSLREAAELLGTTKRTLQRRIQEGAFPGRFLAPGAEGLEMRIPAADVDRARVERMRLADPVPTRTLAPSPARDRDPVLPYRGTEIESISSAPVYRESLERDDLESVRSVVLHVVREEREMFLTAVRDALIVRDREIEELRSELSAVREGVEATREAAQRLEEKLDREFRARADQPAAWSEVLGVPANGDQAVDVDVLLRELGELEAMVGILPEG